MRWNELGKFLIISLAIIGGFIMYINPLANSIKQGLDLQGGTHLIPSSRASTFRAARMLCCRR